MVQVPFKRTAMVFKSMLARTIAHALKSVDPKVPKHAFVCVCVCFCLF